MKKVAVIGTYFTDRDKAIKDAEEKKKARGFPYLVLTFNNGYLVISDRIFKKIAKLASSENE